MTGYLIEYKEKTSFFYHEEPGDNFAEKRNVFCKHFFLKNAD